MHRIRLREPWTAGLSAESGAIVYARKFHKPTGLNEQSTKLRIVLLPRDLNEPTASLVVLVNGCPLSSQMPTNEKEADQTLTFELNDLALFNSLELRICGATVKTGTSGQNFGANAIPPFGSFVIESVELAIE